MLFGELVCSTCHKILTYPFSAISCCCRNCGQFNAAMNMVIVCDCCQQKLLAPVNSVTVVCPCCLSIIDIPLELLPEVNPAPNNAQSDLEKLETMYVSCPTIGKHFGDNNDSNLDFINTFANRETNEKKTCAFKESTLSKSCTSHVEVENSLARDGLATINNELPQSRLPNNKESLLANIGTLTNTTVAKRSEHHVTSGAETSEKARRANRNVLIATRIL